MLKGFGQVSIDIFTYKYEIGQNWFCKSRIWDICGFPWSLTLQILRSNTTLKSDTKGKNDFATPWTLYKKFQWYLLTLKILSTFLIQIK